MKKIITLAIILHSSFYILPSTAAIPISWKVETTRVAPVTFDCYHGEELLLQPSFYVNGSPLQGSFNPVIYWQTNGMETVYWTTNTVVYSGNTAAATFRGSYDPGAPIIRGFIALESTNSVVNYRANFTLRYRPSPGFDPNALPLPPQTIDCSKVKFLNPTNAPWATTACDTNQVNALILSYDMTNITVRFNEKLDLPPILAPTNWIPVSTGNGHAEWMPNMGGGGISANTATNIASSAAVTNAGAVASAKSYADGTFLPKIGQTDIDITSEDGSHRIIFDEDGLQADYIDAESLELSDGNLIVRDGSILIYDGSIFVSHGNITLDDGIPLIVEGPKAIRFNRGVYKNKTLYAWTLEEIGNRITNTTPNIVTNVVSQAYIRQKLGVYLYVGPDNGIFVHVE